MTSHTSVLAEFKGFGIHYDPKEKPYFKSQVLEDLRRIASVPLGQQLLKQIADARPRIRKVPQNVTFKGIVFPRSVNVVIQPTDATNARTFTQPGYELGFLGFGASTKPQHNLSDSQGRSFCHFTGGSVAKGVDDEAKCNGTGCVSVVQFTNAQAITSKGEPAPSFIVFVHELIHSLHHVTGTTLGDDEEHRTTGIGVHSGQPMSENGFRASFGIKRRMAY